MLLCSKTMKRCEWPGHCGIYDSCNLGTSQPYSTNQEPAAPSLEQLEKDAARYRWLREQDIDIHFNGSGDSLCGGNLGWVLDNQIDAAMTHTVQLTQD